jgi:hypothetical protein
VVKRRAATLKTLTVILAIAFIFAVGFITVFSQSGGGSIVYAENSPITTGWDNAFTRTQRNNALFPTNAQGSFFGNDRGVVFGRNRVATHAMNTSVPNNQSFDSLSSSSLTPTDTHFNRHLRVTQSQGFRLGDNGIRVNTREGAAANSVAIITSRFRLHDSAISPYSGVYLALLRSEMEVNFAARFNIRNDGSAPADVFIALNWFPTNGAAYNANHSSIRSGPDPNHAVRIPANSQTSPQIQPRTGQIRIDMLGGGIIPDLTDQCFVELMIIVRGTNVIINEIDIIAELNIPSLYLSEEVSVTVSGENRVTTTVVGTPGEAEFVERMQNVWLKRGDTVRIEARPVLRTGQQDVPYEFTMAYRRAMMLDDIIGQNAFVGFSNVPEDDPFPQRPGCLTWDVRTTGVPAAWDVLTKLKEGNAGVAGSASDSYFVEFTVAQQASTAVMGNITVVPMVFAGFDAEGQISRDLIYGIDRRLQPIVLRLDTERPPTPEILGTNPAHTSTSALGTAIANREWFVDELESVTVQMHDPGHIIRSTQIVYAFVVPPEIVNIDFDSIEYFVTDDIMGFKSYNFAHGAFESLRLPRPGGGAPFVLQPQYIATLAQGDLREVRHPLNFGTSGEHTLILVTVNAAGGVSYAMSYNRTAGRGVRIDAAPYQIDALMLVGGVPASFTMVDYYIVNRHNADGSLLGTVPQGVPTGIPANRNPVAKRNQWVTIRLQVPLATHNNYRLQSVGVMFAPLGVNNTIEPVRIGNNFFYDFTFRLTTQVLENSINATRVEFRFQERLNLTFQQRAFTFTGQPINLANTITMSPITPVSPEILNAITLRYTYFRRVSYTANTASGVNTVTINNQTIPIPAGVNIQTPNQTITFNLPSGTVNLYTTSVTTTGVTNHSVMAIDMDRGQATGFIDAGVYWARVEIASDPSNRFFGLLENTVEITRATPNITGLRHDDSGGHEIRFGNSLDALRFSSDGNLFADRFSFHFAESDGTFYPDRTFFYTTPSGVMGTYRVTVPDRETEAYTRPRPNQMLTLRVTFTPIDVTRHPIYPSRVLSDEPEFIEANWVFYQHFYRRVDGGHVLIEGALHSLNFDAQLFFDFRVYIHPAPATVEILNTGTFGAPTVQGAIDAGAVDFWFSDAVLPLNNGNNSTGLNFYARGQDGVSINLNFLRVWYAPQNEDGTFTNFSASRPLNAGLYMVRFFVDPSLDPLNCVYQSSQSHVLINIQKRNLNIGVASAAFNPADNALTFFFGRFSLISGSAVVAGTGSFGQIGWLQVPVAFLFSIRMVYNENGTFVNEDFRPPVASLNPREIDAGVYEIKIIVNHHNNAGERTLTLNIITERPSHANPAIIENPYLSIFWETQLLSSLQIVNFNDTITTIGTNLNAGHIQFGETLSLATNRLVSPMWNAGYDYGLGFEPFNRANFRFVFESEESILGRTRSPNCTAPLNQPQNHLMILNDPAMQRFIRDGNGNFVLPVLYERNAAGTLLATIAPYRVNLFWEAGHFCTTANEWVRDTNFRRVARQFDLFVVRATATFSQGDEHFVRLTQANGDNILYGTPLRDTHFTGQFGGIPMFAGNNAQNPSLNLASVLVLTRNPSLNNQVYGRGSYAVPISLDFAPANTAPAGFTQAEWTAIRPWYIRNFRTVPMSGAHVHLTVEIIGASVSLTQANATHNFGAVLVPPAVTVLPNNSATPVNVPMIFRFFRNDGTEQNPIWTEISIDPFTPVGTYRIMAIINSNNLYGEAVSGENGFPYFNVVKSNLVMITPPPTTPVNFGVTAGDIPIAPWFLDTPSLVHRVHGTFVFAPLNPTDVSVVLNAGTHQIRVRFIPNNQAEFDLRYNEFFSFITVTVNQGVVAFDVPLAARTKVYDGELFTPEFSVRYGGQDVNYVNVTVRFENLDGEVISTPRNAGSYFMIITVNSNQNYVGQSSPILITITPQPVFFFLNQTHYLHSPVGHLANYRAETALGGAQSDVDWLNISIVYTNHTGMTVVRPTSVGAFNATFTVGNPNFVAATGQNVLGFYIIPSAFALENITVTYGSGAPTATIVPTFTPLNTVLEVHTVINYYRYENLTGLVNDPATARAGVYFVEIIITLNGLQHTYTHYQNGNQITFTVLPRELTLTPVNLSFTYTARAHTIEISREVAVPILFRYREHLFNEKGELVGKGEWTNVAINAGLYDVEFWVDPSFADYSGAGEAVLTINRASLVATQLPEVMNAVFYTGSRNAVVFGMYLVQFPATGMSFGSGADVAVGNGGHWRVADGVDFENLVATTHPIAIEFVPDDLRNFNILRATPQGSDIVINIRIRKLDIGEFIVITPSTLFAEYNTRAHTILATIGLNKDGLTFEQVHGRPLSDLNIGFIYEYDGALLAPRQVGRYQVRARIDNFNYDGVSESGVFLEIFKAIPEINFPLLREVALGATLGSIMDPFVGGFGFLEDENGQIITTVDGRFNFVHPNTQMNAANRHMVWVVFEPSDMYNYSAVEFSMEIFVRGTAVNVTNVRAEAIVYGQRLYMSQITNFSAQTVGGANVTGTLQWLNPMSFPQVGELPFMIFIPDNRAVYNESIFNITFDGFGPQGANGVSQAEFRVDEDKSTGRIYVGQTLNVNNLLLYMYHINFFGDEGWRLQGYSVEILGVTVNNMLILGGNYEAIENDIGSTLVYRLRITHDNYLQTQEFITVGVTVYRQLADENFQQLRHAQWYDGNEVTIEDIRQFINLVNTAHVIDKVVLHQVLLNGAPVGRILDAGDYQITIRVDDPHYFGYFTFNYRINRRDVSAAIRLESGLDTITRMFGDPNTAIALVFWEYILIDGTYVRRDYDIPAGSIVFRYLSLDRLHNFGASPPRDAGEYFIEITIATANEFFVGQAEFKLIITPRPAIIALEREYEFQFGQAILITPYFEVMGATFRLIFGDEHGNISVSPPQAPGRYSVIAELIHQNHLGVSGEIGTPSASLLTIVEAPSIIIQEPTVGSIRFGQALSEARIGRDPLVPNSVDGIVNSGVTSERILGRFEFVNPNQSLNLNENRVQMVFIPNSFDGRENFERVTFIVVVFVHRAEATFVAENQTATFTGNPVLPSITTIPSGLRLNFTFFEIGTTNPVLGINVGEYRVRVTIDENELYQGETEILLTITRAQGTLVTMPSASNIIYRDLFGRSALSGGAVSYFADRPSEFGQGRFEIASIDAGRVAESSGTFAVTFVFIPADERFVGDVRISNFERVYGTINVVVEKRVVRIDVLGNRAVYGDQVIVCVCIGNCVCGGLRFETVSGLAVVNTEFINYFEALSGYPAAGTHPLNSQRGFRAYIDPDNPNYQGEVVFTFVVTRRELRVNFLGAENNVYSMTFNNIVAASAQIDIVSLAVEDVNRREELERGLVLTYRAAGQAGQRIPPDRVGRFTVSVTINDNNYFINANTAVADFIITPGTVEILQFNLQSLTQVYGASFMPIVNVSPAGVNVTIRFLGLSGRPTDAGSYRVVAVVDDPNFLRTEREAVYSIQRRRVTVEHIRGIDKLFDGLPNIDVVGSLVGVLPGDEVELNLWGETVGMVATTGQHQFILTRWAITGRHAGNYEVIEPQFRAFVNIIRHEVRADDDNGSISNSSFNLNDNITFKVTENLVAPENQTTFISTVFGQRATVVRVSVQENGQEVMLSGMTKFYVLIPQSYRRSNNVRAEAIGDLATRAVNFDREGDYITFYADSSGEIVIIYSEFPYWTIIVGSIVLIVILGLVLIKLFEPSKKRKRVSASMQREIAKQHGAKTAKDGYYKDKARSDAYRRSLRDKK